MRTLIIKYSIALFCSTLVGYFLYQSLIQTDFVKKEVKLELLVDCMQASEFQFFLEDDKQVKVANMRSLKINQAAKDTKIVFDIPFVYNPGKIRLDPGLSTGKWILKKLTLKGLTADISYGSKELFEKLEPVHDIKTFKLLPNNEGLLIESGGHDPFVISKFSYATFFDFLNTQPRFQTIPLLFSLCLMLFTFLFLQKKLVAYDFRLLNTTHYFVAAFLFVLFLPFVWMTFFPSTADTGENRTLNSKPSFSINKIIEYPKTYSRYFEDNFGFKKSLSTLNSYYKLKLFNTSSKPELVVVGKNSWLYPTDMNIVGDYQNRKLFSDSELRTIQLNLEEANRFYEARGIHFFVMIMPIKSNIYPENLPNSIIRERSFSKLNQLKSFMDKNSAVEIVDVSAELLAAKSTAEVYYQHDIHMNFQGGYITYKKLMDKMTAFNPNLKPIPIINYKKVMKHIHNADLSRQLSLEDVLLNDEWHLEKTSDVAYKYVDAPKYENVSMLQPIVRTQIKNSKLPKVVVFRDSFFNLIMPYFSEHFSDCIYIWSREMSLEVIDKEQPGFVVYEMLESGIDKLLEDNPNGIHIVK